MHSLRMLKNHLERYLDQHADRALTVSQLIKFIEELEAESVNFCQKNPYDKAG